VILSQFKEKLTLHTVHKLVLHESLENNDKKLVILSLRVSDHFYMHALSCNLYVQNCELKAVHCEHIVKYAILKASRHFRRIEIEYICIVNLGLFHLRMDV